MLQFPCLTLITLVGNHSINRLLLISKRLESVSACIALDNYLRWDVFNVSDYWADSWLRLVRVWLLLILIFKRLMADSAPIFIWLIQNIASHCNLTIFQDNSRQILCSIGFYIGFRYGLRHIRALNLNCIRFDCLLDHRLLIVYLKFF